MTEKHYSDVKEPSPRKELVYMKSFEFLDIGITVTTFYQLSIQIYASS